MNNDKLEAFRAMLTKMQEAKKEQPIAKKPDPEALEKFRARFQEMIRKASEGKKN